MDYHEKILILKKYFSKYVSDRNIQDAENTIRGMKGIHGKVVNTMMEIHTSKEDVKLELLSELQIMSNKMAKIIDDAIEEHEELLSIIEREKNAEKSSKDVKKLNKNAPSLIYFYAEWCGYCKKFLPTWDELEESNVRDDINVVKFSCVTHKEKCDKINIISGYPTIILYNPDTNSATKFEGDRSKETLASFVKSNTNIKLNI